MISACSSLSTSFLKSKPDFRIEEGCGALFLLAIFLNLEEFVMILGHLVFVNSL